MPASMTRAALVGLTLLAAQMTQAATLDGLTLSAEYRVPIDKLYDAATYRLPGVALEDASTAPISFVVGDGADGIVNIEKLTDFVLDFSGNTLEILFDTILPDWPLLNPAAFSGLRITLGPSQGKFTSITQTDGKSVTGFSNNDDELFINLANFSYTNGMKLTFDIGYAAPAPVPLPAGLPLLALAIGGLAVLGRKRAA